MKRKHFSRELLATRSASRFSLKETFHALFSACRTLKWWLETFVTELRRVKPVFYEHLGFVGVDKGCSGLMVFRPAIELLKATWAKAESTVSPVDGLMAVFSENIRK